jgi:hypothetical protein
VAIAPQQVASPDGRTWTVTVERSRRRLKDTRDEPFFWAHVIVTAILVALMIWLLRHTWSGIWAVLIPAMILIWLIGFAVSASGSRIRAETPGPPSEHRVWSITKRSHKERARDGVVAAIGRGDLSSEPPDTRLEEI